MAEKYSRQQIADACRRHCVDVRMDLIGDYDPSLLLWAICGNESSFGANCTPRHEPAYDKGGRYAANPEQAALLEKFGPAAACSYGPMQVMLVNAGGYKPADFADLDKAMAAGVYALNTLLARNKPKTLMEIGACYNGGHVPKDTWPGAVRVYAQHLIMHYSDAMPDEVLQG